MAYIPEPDQKEKQADRTTTSYPPSRSIESFSYPIPLSPSPAEPRAIAYVDVADLPSPTLLHTQTNKPRQPIQPKTLTSSHHCTAPRRSASSIPPRTAVKLHRLSQASPATPTTSPGYELSYSTVPSRRHHSGSSLSLFNLMLMLLLMPQTPRTGAGPGCILPTMSTPQTSGFVAVAATEKLRLA